MSKKSTTDRPVRPSKRHRPLPISYLDEERLRISFSSLVIRVDSINRASGLIKDFITSHDLHGKTNGRLIVISEMMIPGSYLLEIERTVLEPHGLVYNQDYLLLEEQMIHGVGGRTSEYLWKAIPGCAVTSWLASAVTSTGNYVWMKRLLMPPPESTSTSTDIKSAL